MWVILRMVRIVGASEVSTASWVRVLASILEHDIGGRL